MTRTVGTDAAGLDAAARLVARGGVLLYPTETVYGLGGDATHPDVLARVRALKGRDADKPMLALTDDWARVQAWLADVPPALARLMAHEPPLAVTFLLPPSEGAPAGLVGPGGLIGLRRTSDPFCRALVARAGCVLLSTSANPAGAPPPARFADVYAGLLEGVDLAVDAGAPLRGTPSTVVRADGAALVIVREGAVSAEALREIAAG